MKRRDFSLAIASLGAVSLVSAAHAQDRTFKAGTDYVELKQRASVDAPADKVEVIEFFSYNCPHCAEFEGRLEAWVKQLPSYVAFRRVPVAFVGRDAEAKQRLYYALAAMGKVDEYQRKVFEAIHQPRGKPMMDDKGVLEWVGRQQGLDAKAFEEMYRSFSVASETKRATQLQESYQIAGVPSLGVAGRWYVDGETARGLDRALQVVTYLVSEARK